MTEEENDQLELQQYEEDYKRRLRNNTIFFLSILAMITVMTVIVALVAQYSE